MLGRVGCAKSPEEENVNESMKMKNKRMYLLLLGVFSVTLFLSSCRDRETEVSPFKGGFISKYGRYTTEPGKYTIDVSEHPRGILKYHVCKQDGTILIDSNKSDIAVGIYQKWRLYWDNDTEYLWIDSSDRGIYVWIKQADGSYIHDGLQLGKEPSFKDNIPEALRDKIRHKLKN